MKTISIEIPDGKRAEWVNGVLTLVEEPKKCHEFKVGDKAILNRVVGFFHGFGACLVNAGAEVEIVKVSDSADATEKIYEIKHQNSSGTVYGRYLDKIEYKFKVGDNVRTINDSALTYTVTGQFAVDGEPMYKLSDGFGETSCAEKWLALIPQDITERIKTFEDAYQWCVENGEANLVNHYDDWEIYNDTSKDILAYLKLRIITCALNEGWEPTKPNDGDWVAYNPEEDAFYAKRSPAVPVSPKLWFKTAKLALYAAAQFRDIYADFCGCKKGGEK